MIDFRIFLSSPSDCNAERDATQQLAGRLNADPLISSFARVEVAAWDWGAGTPFDALKSPQATVNEFVPTPETCDVFVGIFRRRFGSPLSKLEFRRPDGTQYLSGSEYEFHRAWNARRRGAAKPEIFVYRGVATSPSAPLDEQERNVEAFFAGPPFIDNSEATGAYERFEDTDAFARKLEAALRSVLAKRAPGSAKPLRVWLTEQAASLTANAGPRYTSDAHVSTDIGRVFDWLLVRKEAVEELDDALKELYENLPDLVDFNSGKRALEAFAAYLRSDPLWRAAPDFDSLNVALTDIATKARRARQSNEIGSGGESGQARTQSQQYQDHQLRKADSSARAASQLLASYAPLFLKRVLLLVGPAGQGKTHTLVHEVNRTLRDNGVALGVLGQTLNHHGPIWEAIRLRVGWDKPVDSLLDALDNEAAQSGQRALIVIDAMNEMPDRKRWRTELMGMIQQLLRRPHLTLALAVRSDYLKMVLPDVELSKEAPWVTRQHPGFTGVEPAGLANYFSFYGIKVPSAPALGEFGNPLYVRMLARSLVDTEFKHWQPSWLHVWKTWIDRLEQDALERLDCDDPSRPNPVRRTMNRLAQTMLEAPYFVLTRFQADAIATQTSGLPKLIEFLCSAGALVDRIDGDDEEVIEFGFERLSDTFFVDRLLAKVFANLEHADSRREALIAALQTGGQLECLGSNAYTDHPLSRRRAGLLSALCLAAPRHVGAEIPTILSGVRATDGDWVMSHAFVDSLRWRSNPSDFGMHGEALYGLWLQHSSFTDEATRLDELIRFALIPGHPLGMTSLLHPRLLAQQSIGARDAWWSVELPSIWSTEKSNVRQLVNWSCEAHLEDVQSEVALPAAQLLAWLCAASQNELRREAMHGLTRLLSACPRILPDFLPDFLSVDDPYILEAVLVALWGCVLQGPMTPELSDACCQVLTSQFPDGNARWCHITVRHYARAIVEAATAVGGMPPTDGTSLPSMYRSKLPLAAVPDRGALEKLSDSVGFRRVIFSSSEGDFYRYIIGGNWASLKVSGTPLAGSDEPTRPLSKAPRGKLQQSRENVFDISLAGRFVAWNALALGYTGERFDAFDTGYETQQLNRMGNIGHTERIGKKYQWIGWHTLLAFLVDNYELRPSSYDGTPSFRGPEFFGVETYDPARWLHGATRTESSSNHDDVWGLPDTFIWPSPDKASMHAWIHSEERDPRPADIVELLSGLPSSWGPKSWIRAAAEHVWTTSCAPGYWGLGYSFHADLWIQLVPVLVRAPDFPILLDWLDSCSEHQSSDGRLDFYAESDVPMSEWPDFQGEWDCGFNTPDEYSRQGKLGVPFRIFAAECGHPDKNDEQAPVILPAPSLFREWALKLQMNQSLIRDKSDVVFGLSNALSQRSVLFANVNVLLSLLQESDFRLVWFVRGERRAFQKLGSGGEEGQTVWADYHGVAYLGLDGRAAVARLTKVITRDTE
ncbi:DUF4062 domain-containing protein [Paraburkholderia terrae]|uniref:DUF4062 domain-containing protein n=1 Tax=Paraburkholderia terrae TaxID=311230 RepID=UPI00296ADA34|nr:DUF4062 domain-containing protein [Paraburkholderia terrae]MDW3657385.1 DUF4062 domain-containing protein [Paraburkholderia terrae]